MGTKDITKDIGKEEAGNGYDDKKNIEIYEIYKEPALDMIVSEKRLQWLEHIEIMTEGRSIYKKRRIQKTTTGNLQEKK